MDINSDTRNEIGITPNFIANAMQWIYLNVVAAGIVCMPVYGGQKSTGHYRPGRKDFVSSGPFEMRI